MLTQCSPGAVPHVWGAPGKHGGHYGPLPLPLSLLLPSAPTVTGHPRSTGRVQVLLPSSVFKSPSGNYTRGPPHGRGFPLLFPHLEG